MSRAGWSMFIVFFLSIVFDHPVSSADSPPYRRRASPYPPAYKNWDFNTVLLSVSKNRFVPWLPLMRELAAVRNERLTEGENPLKHYI